MSIEARYREIEARLEEMLRDAALVEHELAPAADGATHSRRLQGGIVSHR